MKKVLPIGAASFPKSSPLWVILWMWTSRVIMQGFPLKILASGRRWNLICFFSPLLPHHFRVEMSYCQWDAHGSSTQSGLNVNVSWDVLKMCFSVSLIFFLFPSTSPGYPWRSLLSYSFSLVYPSCLFLYLPTPFIFLFLPFFLCSIFTFLSIPPSSSSLPLLLSICLRPCGTTLLEWACLSSVSFVA